MSHIRYHNQAGPFWDWVGDMASTSTERGGVGSNNFRGGCPWFQHDEEDPWARSFPHQPHRHESHPNPSQQRDPPAPRSHEGSPPPNYEMPNTSPPAAPAESSGGPTHHRQYRGSPGHHRGRSHHRGGGCRSGRDGPFGRHGPFAFGGPQSDGNPFTGLASMFGWGSEGFDPSKMREFFEGQFGVNQTTDKKRADNDADFTPPCDVFDTPDAYVIHFSLAGAKKEDISLNWDADKSELHVAGVVYRPGDEGMLKTLAMNERDVGVFERKVKLGSKANPANVDSDGITAKMEDGVLVVKVPKTEEFEEIRKVDIE